MNSLTRSARSSGPVVILVTFSVMFATTWSHDRPTTRPASADMARPETLASGSETTGPDVTATEAFPDATPSPAATGESPLVTGLRSLATVYGNRGVSAVSVELRCEARSGKRVAEQKRSCFSGGAAFLCGTLRDEMAPRAAELEDEADWALE